MKNVFDRFLSERSQRAEKLLFTLKYHQKNPVREARQNYFLFVVVYHLTAAEGT